jgi:phosphoglycerate dehydrogenase-like enzyme
MEVLILEPIGREAREWLSARHPVRVAPELVRDPIAHRRALAEARALILPAGIVFDTGSIVAAPKLRAVARVSTGIDGIDADACHKAKIEVVRPLVASATAEAEFMLGAALKLLRRLPDSGRIREGRELGTATVGLIGMSPAARALSQLLVGFGCRVIGYDPAIHSSDALWNRWRIQPVSLRRVLAHSDVVCVQLQFFTRYRGLLGERLLPHCKSNQVIVSISTSAVFDEDALARALDNGVIAACWLDHPEPGLADPGRPLAGVKRLYLSKQLAGATREARQRSEWMVVKRLDELLSGRATPAPPAAPAGLAADPESQ